MGGGGEYGRGGMVERRVLGGVYWPGCGRSQRVTRKINMARCVGLGYTRLRIP